MRNSFPLLAGGDQNRRYKRVILDSHQVTRNKMNDLTCWMCWIILFKSWGLKHKLFFLITLRDKITDVNWT